MTKSRLYYLMHRHLDPQTISDIRQEYWEDFREKYPEDAAEIMDDQEHEHHAITDEQCARLSPEEVLRIIVGWEFPIQWNHDDPAETIIGLLSRATGRPKEELRTAIFGEKLDDMSEDLAFTPSAEEEKFFYFICDYMNHMKDERDEKGWPKGLSPKWKDLVDNIPEERQEALLQNIRHFLENKKKYGVPWLSK